MVKSIFGLLGLFLPREAALCGISHIREPSHYKVWCEKNCLHAGVGHATEAAAEQQGSEEQEAATAEPPADVHMAQSEPAGAEEESGPAGECDARDTDRQAPSMPQEDEAAEAVQNTGGLFLLLYILMPAHPQCESRVLKTHFITHVSQQRPRGLSEHAVSQ